MKNSNSTDSENKQTKKTNIISWYCKYNFKSTQNQSVGLGKRGRTWTYLSYPSPDLHVHLTYFNMFKLFPLLIVIQRNPCNFLKKFLRAHAYVDIVGASHMHDITKKNKWPNLKKQKIFTNKSQGMSPWYAIWCTHQHSVRVARVFACVHVAPHFCTPNRCLLFSLQSKLHLPLQSGRICWTGVLSI